MGCRARSPDTSSAPAGEHPLRAILTTADWVLIAAILSAACAGFAGFGIWSSEGSTVLISVNGNPVYRTRLDENARISVEGVRGPLVVEIRDGNVRVAEADCPNHICVRTGWRHRAGEAIVCVPNKTVVMIVSDRTDGVRAVTG